MSPPPRSAPGGACGAGGGPRHSGRPARVDSRVRGPAAFPADGSSGHRLSGHPRSLGTWPESCQASSVVSCLGGLPPVGVPVNERRRGAPLCEAPAGLRQVVMVVGGTGQGLLLRFWGAHRSPETLSGRGVHLEIGALPTARDPPSGRRVQLGQAAAWALPPRGWHGWPPAQASPLAARWPTASLCRGDPWLPWCHPPVPPSHLAGAGGRPAGDLGSGPGGGSWHSWPRDREDRPEADRRPGWRTETLLEVFRAVRGLPRDREFKF